jgi:hypothetical protein
VCRSFRPAQQCAVVTDVTGDPMKRSEEVEEPGYCGGQRARDERVFCAPCVRLVA